MSKVASIAELIKDIDGLRERDIPYIAMLATNDTAFGVKKEIDRQIMSRLKIHKKKLGTSVRVKKARKGDNYARVFIDEWAWQHKVLDHHFFGGDRHRKGLEKAMIHFGHMASDDILTPPPGVTIRPSTYVKIISQLKLVYKAGYAANQTKRSKFRNKTRQGERFFVIGRWTRSRLKPGIYASMPGLRKPVSILRIAKRPNYAKIFDDFDKTATEVYNKNFDRYLTKAMDKVLFQNKVRGWA